MGLVTGLFTWPLAPLRGVIWVGERLQEQAEQELDDPSAIRRRLREVQAARDAGTISDQEAADQEAEILGRLWESRPGGGGGKV